MNQELPQHSRKIIGTSVHRHHTQKLLHLGAELGNAGSKDAIVTLMGELRLKCFLEPQHIGMDTLKRILLMRKHQQGTGITVGYQSTVHCAASSMSFPISSSAFSSSESEPLTSFSATSTESSAT